MSQSTSITEGGKGRPFGPVKALMVQGEDGKYYSWYPESERALGTLSVDKNGVYRASDKGVYGWGQVYVNVAQTDSVTGKDPDTGEEVVVRPDPETGEITETVVPVEIRVIEPPTNPYGVYVDGQTITKEGMVVKAYLRTGGEYGTVPNSELTLNPTTVSYDSGTEQPAEYTSSLVDVPVYAGIPSFDSSKATQYMSRGLYIGPGTCTRVQDGGNVVIASASETTWGYQYYDENDSPTGSGTYPISQSWTYDNKTVYYTVSVMNYWVVPVTNGNPYKVKEIAWTMIYGTQETRPGSLQTITVSWPRPGDGAVLETTFDILVGPHGGTGDD